MMRMEAVFGRDSMTPDIAAKLATAAEHHRARLELECGGKVVLLDSLIGILSLECRRGTRLTILADGEDERAAAEAIRAVLE